MKHTSKVVLLSIMGILLFGSYMTLATAQTPPVDTPIGENNYQGSIAGNETSQFTFRNRFQFRIRTNVSLELDMDVEVDQVGDREFELEINTQEQAELTIRINGSDENLGLENGTQVQARNQNRYRYQEQFRLNISCDEPVEAKLSLKTEDSEAKWAYYDEDKEDWVTVESSYQDGVLTAETNHFSVWTVLTPDESSIPAYSLIGFVTIGSIMGLLIITKKKK